MRPSLRELNEIIQADMGKSNVRFNLKSIFAKGIAGLTHSLYGYVDKQIENRMPDTASKETLERWTKIWGYERNPATFAQGLIVINATESIKLEAGSTWLHDSDYEYRLEDDTQLESGENELRVTCIKSGLEGNRLSGDLLTITQTVAGLNSSAKIISIEGGYEQESDKSLRRRFLRRLSLPPQGGAVHDYIDWAESLPDVFKAWVDPIPDEKLGHVSLTFLTPDIENPIPSKEQALKVCSELEKIRPAGSRLDVSPPIRKEVSIEISKLEPAALFPKVEKAITDLFQDKLKPSGYLDAYQSKQESKISPYDIFQAVSQIEGLVELDFSPKEIIKAEAKGEMLVLKEVSYEGNI